MEKKMSAPKTKPKRTTRFTWTGPGYIAYVVAGPVTVRKADGTVETRPAYSKYQFQYVVRRSAP